ncbi:3-isopropylmalate dehydrogenase [uncultured delta proteobacterium]|uniref:3-isopropylmalate dehydrogenase n=1 Tax=uncultured delta proteobacterium TaxID=34034 RepID=A0A212JJM4_9DELT|nr:3-isopropylmalate dehydrogenase [uncultured delta proteobacterium]
MNHHLVVLPGDGIGPEIVAQALAVLDAAEKRFGFTVAREEHLLGGAAIDATGDPLPQRTLDACKKADAVLLGAVGGPKWDALPHGKRPESGLLGIRKALNLYANIRPATVFPELSSLSGLRPDAVKNGIDLVVVRELTGDVYFGQPAGMEVRDGVRHAFNTMIYNENEIRRIATVGFETAMLRKKRMVSVDKANVLASSRLWREIVDDMRREYPEVAVSHMYVDNCTMQLVINPAQFDVILTGNLFGDILSDEASAICGSLGLLPSASVSGLGKGGGAGIFEPIHGSAPDIAGQDKANPLATILSLAMMLDMAFARNDAATAITEAVRGVLKAGYRTGDIASSMSAPKLVGCKEMGSLVAAAVLRG